ncbi:GntR family transcriptional regulator [Kiloniella majae]|uniref:GntR family transcriptional regulator n=1 Tax=Kiloniella majae TaxID=1938558 RepID=UPI000A278646|nr:GntR family transcriptional regulator [Kiloniella majae]
MTSDHSDLKSIVSRFTDEQVSTPVFVANVLREAIISGTLPPHSLVRQDTAADSMGVSKIPVREALRTLEGENLISFERNRGARVLPGSIREMIEIFELRKVIEPHLLQLSIPNLTDEDLSGAQNLITREAQSTNQKELGELNRQFHEIILSGAKETIGYKFQTILFTTSERYLRLSLKEPSSQTRSNAEHQQLITACIDRDGDKAKELLVKHLESAQNVIHEKLKQDKSVDP